MKYLQVYRVQKYVWRSLTIILYVYVFDKFGIPMDTICGCFSISWNWSFEILFSMDVALTKSAMIYTKKYTFTYITQKYDPTMIGPISKRISHI